MTPTESSGAKDSSTPAPVRRDWIDITFRVATSWVGLFSAYVVALILALTKYKELATALQGMGLPPWIGIALIAAFPLCALVFSTIPSVIDQRRIKRYSEITGTIQTGYFTLRPRENDEKFERADNAHEEILRWIKNTREPVLYLTGASGTGKSSLLSAWVLPKLRSEKHIVCELRGYEDVLARLQEELLTPGLVWDRPPARSNDPGSLLSRAIERLGGRRIVIVVDQFEEFLILADQDRQSAFQQFLAGQLAEGVTMLLVFRPEYEGVIQSQPWPKMRIDANRKVISPFTESAAQKFFEDSRLKVNADMLRTVLREAAKIDQTVGLIRPVTINMCGLVLSRFSGGLPRRFRGGLIRGFLRESLSLVEVRDVAGKLIPQLITDNVTKRPRTIDDLAKATSLPPAALYACLRRLGESDRAVVRPLDKQQETWEISHDFLVPLLDAIIARRTVSLWRRARPWLPWAAAAILGVVALVVPLIKSPDVTAELRKQGWTISEDKAGLHLRRNSGIPEQSISILRSLPAPYGLALIGTDVADVSALRGLKGLTTLNLFETKVADLSALQELKGLSALEVSFTKVADISALRELRGLKELDLGGTNVADISALRELRGLKELDLNRTEVVDISALRGLRELTTLDLGGTKVTDVSALRQMKGLKKLDLSDTKVTDLSALQKLKGLTTLELGFTNITDISALREMKGLTTLGLSYTKVAVSELRELKGLTTLDLSDTNIEDISALREMKGLTTLNLNGTPVADISALRELMGLSTLNLSSTPVADISALRGLKGLTTLDIRSTDVADVSALRQLKGLTTLDIRNTNVTDVSALRDLKALTIRRD